MGFFKDFTVREGMKLELRAEFFNLTNSVRFRTPDSFLGDTTFGKVTRQGEPPAKRTDRDKVRVLIASEGGWEDGWRLRRTSRPHA